MPRSKKNRKNKYIVSSNIEEGESSLLKLDALIEQAESAVDTFDYELAETKLNEILHVDPNNTKCLEMLSSIYIEKFEWQGAQDLLLRCIEISPEVGYSKYFSIAELCDGLESVKYYEKGIQLIEKELENNENIEPSKEGSKSTLIKNLSDAYCSIAEIFMTDCCFEENAEEKCRSAIDLAIKADPSNPESYQCLATYQLVKDQEEEAKESIQKSLSLWLPHHERLRANDESSENDSETLIPNYDSRIKTSKLLIELEMYYEASKILEGLLDENDEVVQVWYLLGWLNYIRGEEDYKENAHFYLKKAVEVSKKMGVEKEECAQHAKELVEELKTTHPLDDDDEEEEEKKVDDDDDDEVPSDLCTDSEEEMET